MADRGWLAGVWWTILAASCVSGGPHPTPTPTPTPVAMAAPVDGPSPAQPPTAAPPPPAAPRAAPADLAPSTRFVVERVLEAKVLSLAAGVGDRLAVLADRGGTIVPHRFEAGRWQELPLPASATSAVGSSSLGMFFGRDNRPRLMGSRDRGGAPRMVYLRHRDGAWRDARGEIGSLAGDGSVLFGVLGDDDPEIVCKVGGICLRKSRAGWKELANVLPETAVIRAFAGAGYALVAEGVMLASDTGFTRIGPPPAWATEATGFWVGADGAIVVVEPAADALHLLAPGADAWTTEPSPVRGPRDVMNAPGDRWVAGAGGLAHQEDGRWVRVGDPSWSLRRVVPTAGGVVAGGPSGVVHARPTDPPR